jgi:hypothetical protein
MLRGSGVDARALDACVVTFDELSMRVGCAPEWVGLYCAGGAVSDGLVLLASWWWLVGALGGWLCPWPGGLPVLPIPVKTAPKQPMTPPAVIL